MQPAAWCLYHPIKPPFHGITSHHSHDMHNCHQIVPSQQSPPPPPGLYELHAATQGTTKHPHLATHTSASCQLPTLHWSCPAVWCYHCLIRRDQTGLHTCQPLPADAHNLTLPDAGSADPAVLQGHFDCLHVLPATPTPPSQQRSLHQPCPLPPAPYLALTWQ